MFDDDSYMAYQQGLQIINHLRQIDKVEEQLKYILILIHSLPQDKMELFRNDLVYFEKLFKDPNFIRQMRERDAIVTDYAMEYFGKDFGESDPFLFKAELEEKITRISMRIMETAGKIVQEIKEGTEFEIPEGI
jgi:hypothetical protein